MNETKREDVRLAVTNAAAGILAGVADQEARGKLLTEIRNVEGGRPYRVQADGTPASLEGWMTQPTMVRADVELYDMPSFAAYVNRFKNAESLVFADERASTFTAVLDYHQAPAGDKGIGPRWLRNRAFLKLVHTDEWNEWMAHDGKGQSQDAFAQFLEDHIPDIAEPSGALLVEIARSLEASISGSFKSAIRAQDGSITFGYVKDVQASAKDGAVKVPTEVKLMLKPYESLPDRYPVIGKLRYRITGGSLTLWFDMFGVDEAIEEAFGDLRTNVESEVAPSIVLAGPAPKAQTAE